MNLQPNDQANWNVTDTLAVPVTILVIDGDQAQVQRGDRRPWVRVSELSPIDQLV